MLPVRAHHPTRCRRHRARVCRSAVGLAICLAGLAVGVDSTLAVPADSFLAIQPETPAQAWSVEITPEDIARGYTNQLLVKLREPAPPAGASEGPGGLTSRPPGTVRDVSAILTASINAAAQPVPSELAQLGSVKPFFRGFTRAPQVAKALGLQRWLVLQLPRSTDPRAVLDTVRAMPGIEAAELDTIGFLHGAVPNDPSFSLQWALRNSGQTIAGVPGTSGVDVRAIDAWSLSLGSSDVLVAVLDSGVSLSHPDLAGHWTDGVNTLSPGASFDDNFSTSHGTYCSGIISAAFNNSLGVAGLAPNCKILPVKVVNGAAGSESTVAAGLLWATDAGASVANMSLGFSTGGSAFRDAVVYANTAGCVLVSSTGNAPGSAIGFPAKWSEVIAVGATDNRDFAAAFETTGPEMDIAAPGMSIYTTSDTWSVPNGYAFQSGTSMAAPFVTATAALMRSVNRSLTPTQVQAILESTAIDLGPPGKDVQYGAGRLNTFAAVQGALAARPGCLSDINNDGVTNEMDLFAFLDGWFSGQRDYNADGRTDVLDLFLFLECWFVQRG